MNLDAEYKKYVEHWGDPIDPINYKLYSIETDMPYFILTIDYSLKKSLKILVIITKHLKRCGN